MTDKGKPPSCFNKNRIHCTCVLLSSLDSYGPISLLDETRLTIAVATYKKLLDKTISNIIEVKARGSKVLSVVTENSAKVKEVSDDFIEIPDASDIFLPVLGVIALQLFAYYIAYEKGCDIDKPKNLAKSVTVE